MGMWVRGKSSGEEDHETGKELGRSGELNEDSEAKAQGGKESHSQKGGRGELSQDSEDHGNGLRL